MDMSEYIFSLLLGGAISVASSVALVYAMYRFAHRRQPQRVTSPSYGMMWGLPASALVVAAAPSISCADVNDVMVAVSHSGWVLTRFGAHALTQASSIVS